MLQPDLLQGHQLLCDTVVGEKLELPFIMVLSSLLYVLLLSLLHISYDYVFASTTIYKHPIHRKRINCTVTETAWQWPLGLSEVYVVMVSNHVGTRICNWPQIAHLQQFKYTRLTILTSWTISYVTILSRYPHCSRLVGGSCIASSIHA